MTGRAWGRTRHARKARAHAELVAHVTRDRALRVLSSQDAAWKTRSCEGSSHYKQEEGKLDKRVDRFGSVEVG
jgi:hypothetical protein